MTTVNTWQLRDRFARRLSDLYGMEVPAYTTLLAVSNEVNADVLREHGADAERLGTISRVTAERHGAIRVGTPDELAQATRIFAAMGMHPTGFYDLRDAAPAPIPVVSTAFRPLEARELARNPFRVFVSMLVPQDRRFFNDDLAARLTTFLSGRRLFPEELLLLADRAENESGLSNDDASRFLDLAVRSFALSREPVDRAWYAELERVSSVAADIGGVATTHINHLTPRVLDIDELYRRMMARGIEMIDRIQGPPRWDGPDLLLRQTSFRALAEPRLFREPGGDVFAGDLRVRFGEVEARGVAPTPAGLALYNRLIAATDESAAANPGISRGEITAELWREHLPTSEHGLIERDLAFFSFRLKADRPRDAQPPREVTALLADGWIDAEPLVYEDFLPRSAAGIFASNLTSQGTLDPSHGGAPRDREWMSQVIGRPISDPMELYAAQRAESLARVADELGLAELRLPDVRAQLS